MYHDSLEILAAVELWALWSFNEVKSRAFGVQETPYKGVKYRKKKSSFRACFRP